MTNMDERLRPRYADLEPINADLESASDICFSNFAERGDTTHELLFNNEVIGASVVSAMECLNCPLAIFGSFKDYL